MNRLRGYFLRKLWNRYRLRINSAELAMVHLTAEYELRMRSLGQAKLLEDVKDAAVYLEGIRQARETEILLEYERTVQP